MKDTEEQRMLIIISLLLTHTQTVNGEFRFQGRTILQENVFSESGMCSWNEVNWRV